MRFLQRLYALALYHPPVAHKDKFLHLKFVSEDLDLIDHRRRIRRVALKHPHRQWFAFPVGQQANDDL